MSFLIVAQDLSYRTPDGHFLFETLSLAFGRERAGIVGPNGAGKTTLLKLLAGDLAPASGSVTRSGTVGVLRQDPAPAPGDTVGDLLGASEALRRLERIERGEGAERDFELADWDLPARLEAALAEVGLAALELSRPAGGLSGGEVTRVGLAGLLARRPDIILLDEPTNNLDRDARALIGEAVGRWKGGAVVVSHDRALLERMERTVELSGGGARVYGGGYDLYRRRRAEETAAAERELHAAELALGRVQRDVQQARERKSRRDAAGRRARARGDAPKILLDARADRAEVTGGRGERLATRLREAAQERLEAARAQVDRSEPLSFRLPGGGLSAGRTVLTMEDVAFAHPGSPPLFEGLDLRVVGPERIAVSGPNGSGKSTLLGLICGDLEPTRGAARLGVRAVRLDQRAALLEDRQSLVDNFRRLNPVADLNRAHAALARFGFRARAALKPAGELSGGERMRAALACVLGSDRPPELLILDEPTNHLDLTALEAVEQALAEYDGALLVVSHDEAFLEAVATQRTITLPLSKVS